MRSTGPGTIRKAFLGSVLLGLVLVILGRILTPSAALLSTAGAGLVLIGYGAAGYFGFPRLRPEILAIAGLFGLLAGVVLAGEIVLEYAVLPKDNTSWGILEYGSVFGLFFIASLWAAYRSRSMVGGMQAAVVGAKVSSAVWLNVLLLTFFLFRGTARQEAVFRAEGNYADFARSGMSNFEAFIMEDFLGAGFFHLLLAPIAAAILGTIGGLAGKASRSLSMHGRVRYWDS